MRTNERRKQTIEELEAQLKDMLLEETRLSRENLAHTLYARFLATLVDFDTRISLLVSTGACRPSLHSGLQLHTLDARTCRAEDATAMHQTYLDAVKECALLLLNIDDQDMRFHLEQVVERTKCYMVGMVVFNQPTVMDVVTKPLVPWKQAAAPAEHCEQVVRGLDWGDRSDALDFICLTVSAQLEVLRHTHTQRAELSTRLAAAVATGDSIETTAAVTAMQVHMDMYAHTNKLFTLMHYAHLPNLVVAQLWVRFFPWWPLALMFAVPMCRVHRERLQAGGKAQELQVLDMAMAAAAALGRALFAALQRQQSGS